MAKDPLRRVRDFAADDVLARQLRQVEDNVSDMGQALLVSRAARLTKTSESTRASNVVILPGQYQRVDTRLGTPRLTLAKPKAEDDGLFVVLVDLGGAAGSIQVDAAKGCTVDAAASVFVTVTHYAAIIFCDGANYWRV